MPLISVGCKIFRFSNNYQKAIYVIWRLSNHKTPAGEEDIIFKGLGNPFWIADFRDYQATEPNHKKFNELGAKIICLEKIRPHVDLERAIMGIRLSEEMVATQFHPEADAKGMLVHFKQPKRMEHVVKVHGEKKY